MIPALLLPLVSIAASTAAPAETPSPVVVQAVLSKSEVTVGERFTVELRANGPSGTTYTFPAEATDDAFELRSPPPSSAALTDPGTHRYAAAVFALGETRIPPMVVRYRLPDGTSGEATTAPITVKVVSLLPKGPQQHKLADIRGPVPVRVGRVFWLALGLAAMLVASLIVWLLRRRRKSAPPSAVGAPELPPDLEATRALDTLATSGLLASGDFRGFYIAITAIAKRYLERRLEAPVLEMTSIEALAFLRSHAHGGLLLPVLRDLTEAADRVKFANGTGLAAEAERHLAATRSLVPALEARLRPALTEARAA